MTTHAAQSASLVAPATERQADRWYVLALLVLGYAAYTFDKNVISVLIEPIKAEFAMSDTQISVLMGIAMTAPFALACIPLGLLADRVSRKRLLVALIVGWSLMTGGAGLAVTLPMLFLARAGVGVFEAGFTPVSLSILSDTFPRQRRATAMGLYNLGVPLGTFLGMAVGGWVAARHGWRSAFFIAGIPGLVLALVIALSMKEAQRGRFDPPEAHPQKAGFGAVLGSIWRDRVLLHVMLGMVFCAVMPAAIAIWTPSFLIRVHGFDIRQAGLAAAVVIGLGGATGAAVGGLLGDRLGKTDEWRKLWVPLVGVSMSMALVLVATLGSGGSATVLVLLGLSAFFAQSLLGPGYGIAAGRCTPATRAATFSVLLVAFNIVTYGLGTMALGLVSDAFKAYAGPRAIAFGIASACVFGLLGLLHLLRSMHLMRQASRAAVPASAMPPDLAPATPR